MEYTMESKHSIKLELPITGTAHKIRGDVHMIVTLTKNGDTATIKIGDCGFKGKYNYNYGHLMTSLHLPVGFRPVRPINIPTVFLGYSAAFDRERKEYLKITTGGAIGTFSDCPGRFDSSKSDIVGFAGCEATYEICDLAKALDRITALEKTCEDLQKKIAELTKSAEFDHPP